MLADWKKRLLNPIGVFWIYVLVVVGLSACSTVDTQPTAPIDTTLATDTALTQPTNTPEVATPTTEPALVILLTPPGSDPDLALSTQGLLAELTQEDGLDFQTRSEISDADWDADVRLVVSLPPDPGLGELVSAHPDVQFLALGFPGLEPSGNLSVVGGQGNRSDRQGFLAGYLAAVITQDWRVGVISRFDTPAGKAAQGGFINGAIFYCGLCRPAYPPFFQYPVVASVPEGAGEGEQGAAVDMMVSNAVQSVYVAPDAGDETMLVYLAESGINIIGSVPPPAQIQDNWIATVQIDWAGAVREAWPRLTNGEGGLVLEGITQFVYPNENLFSPGRQRFVERMLADLLAGFIETGVDPLTGEPR